MKISQQIKKDGPIHTIKMFWPEHTPHWQVHTDGRAELRITTHDNAKWVSLDAAEFAEKSTKRTMLTLDEAAGRALYNRLKELYE